MIPLYVPVPSRWRGLPLGVPLGLLLTLATTGVWLASGRGTRAVAVMHALAAGALLLLAIALVARSLVAMRGSNRERKVWLMLVAALAGALALHATGSALAPGERGAEGLAHAAAAVAPLPAPSRELVLVTHALGLPLVLLAPLAVWRREIVLGREWRPVVAWCGGTLVAFAVLAVALPVAEPVPEIRGIEAARAPWPLLALEPLESSIGVPLALGVLLLTFLFLAVAPLVAPPRLARRALLLVAAVYLALTLAAGLAPPATHLALGVGS